MDAVRTSRVALTLLSLGLFFVCCEAGAVCADQFPGQDDWVRQSADTIAAQRREQAERPRTVARTAEGRSALPADRDYRGSIQLDRWTYAPGVAGVDPLTQIVRLMERGALGSTSPGVGGSAFLLPDCRVMTNLHVIIGDNPDYLATVRGGGSLAGEEFVYVSSPVPWLDHARVLSNIVILGHGKPQSIDDQGAPDPWDEDWAIGYDMGCASERFGLGVLQLGEPIADPSDLAGLKTFTAGFTQIRASNIATNSYPLYLDSQCKVVRSAHIESSPSTFGTNCSIENGASGQPFLSGVLTSPGHRFRFQSRNGRPMLVVKGIVHSGAEWEDVKEGLRGTKGQITLFDAAVRQRLDRFLSGHVNLARLRRTPDQSWAHPVAILRPQPTETVRKRMARGNIELEFVVRANGTVRDVTLLKGLDPELDAAVLAAARRWHFSPEIRNGVAVEATYGYHLPY